MTAVNPMKARIALLAASKLVSFGLPVLWLQSPAKASRRTPEGERPIPPERRGKAPVMEGWASLPAQSYEDLIDQFGDGEPGYNVGIRTGRVADARLCVVVIDLDSPEALAWARENLPETQVKVRTRSGEHWYYRLPPGKVGNRVKVVLGGEPGCRHGGWRGGEPGTKVRDCAACGARRLDLDVKGDGGLVVGPSSVHGTGVRYEGVLPWTQERVDSMPLFDPAWFGSAEWEGAEDPKLKPGQGGGDRRPPTYVDLSSKKRRALAYLEACPGTVSGQGTASNDCLGFARALVYGLCLPPEEASRIMVASEWNSRCTTSSGDPYPWSGDELLHKCKDAYRLQYDKPYGFLLVEADKAEPEAESDPAAEELGRVADEAREVEEASSGWDLEIEEREIEDLRGRRFELDDTGNAERLIARFGESVRFAADREVWYAWDPSQGRWVAREIALQRCSKVVARKIADEFPPCEERLAAAEEALAMFDPPEKGLPAEPARREAEAELKRAQVALNALKKHYRESASGPKRREMVRLASSDPTIVVASDSFDRDPFLLNCRNGVLDLRCGELRPHDRDLYMSKCCPVAYDPEAEAPTWEECLRRWMAGDEEAVAFLRRIAGYCLTGDVSEEAIFLLCGPGANGKSTFVNALRAVLGPSYGTTAPAGLLMETRQDKATPSQQAGLASLVGTRLVAASETDDSAHLSQAQAKAISCRDKISAKRMYENPFDFWPSHKTLLSTNYEPAISGTDDGIWRRIHLIRWLVKITAAERDNRLAEKLYAERAGILRWMLAGCLEWQEIGLAPPEAVKAAHAAYRATQDTVGAFCDDLLAIDGVSEVGRSAVRAAYEAWCEVEGCKPFGPKRFAQELTRRGLREHRTNNARLWKGGKLKGPGR